MITRITILVALLAMSATGAAAADPSAYIGMKTCSTSGCHGSPVPLNEKKVNQNEFTIWSTKDKHRNSYSVLENSLSKQIAERLGLGKPTEAPRCLACHSPLAATGQTKDPQTIASGVSCEFCHGGGRDYLGTHVAEGNTHEANVKAGMLDLKNPAKRAEVCLACHLGNEAEKKSVDHELIGAGHPDLFFDLARFYTVMPFHSRSWKPDSLEALKSWAVGQAQQIHEHMQRVGERAKDKIWPEYAELRCDACHHSLTTPEESWRQQHGYPGRRPGNIPFQTSRVAVLMPVLRALGGDAKGLDSACDAVFVEMSKVEPNRTTVVSAAAKAASKAKGEVDAVAGKSFEAGLVKKIFEAVVADREAIAYQGHRAALQTAWLLHLLVNVGKAEGVTAGGGEGTLKEIDGHLNAPITDDPSSFGNPSGYNAAKFVELVKTLGEKVTWKK
jgi:hypothetical protein